VGIDVVVKEVQRITEGECTRPRVGLWASLNHLSICLTFLFVFLFLLVVVGLELGTSYLLGRHYTT
jgi:hypothetical protein